MVTTVLAVLGGLTLVLTAAARIPRAVAELLRACIPLIAALREVRAQLASSHRLTGASTEELGSCEHPVDPDQR